MFSRSRMLVVVGLTAVLGSGSVAASGAAGAATPILSGFQQPFGQFLVQPRSHTGYSVACPSGTQVLGGGVTTNATNLAIDVASSWPSDDHTWSAYVNNATSSYLLMTVYANCAAVRTKYRIVQGTPVNFSTSQKEVDADCPAKSVAYGGGVYNTATDLGVDLNSTLPFAPGWTVYDNDDSNVPNQATGYVVCGPKPAGYVAVTGSVVTVPPGGQSLASVTCPKRTVALGGGGLSNSGLTAVNLAATVPAGPSGWSAASNNASSTNWTVYAKAVCAKVTA